MFGGDFAKPTTDNVFFFSVITYYRLTFRNILRRRASVIVIIITSIDVVEMVTNRPRWWRARERGMWPLSFLQRGLLICFFYCAKWMVITMWHSPRPSDCCSLLHIRPQNNSCSRVLLRGFSSFAWNIKIEDYKSLCPTLLFLSTMLHAKRVWINEGPRLWMKAQG